MYRMGGLYYAPDVRLTHTWSFDLPLAISSLSLFLSTSISLPLYPPSLSLSLPLPDILHSRLPREQKFSEVKKNEKGKYRDTFYVFPVPEHLINKISQKIVFRKS